MAWSFFLWGLHHLDYPFLRAQGAWNPWGYYLDIVFELSIGVSILLLVVEDQHRGLGVLSSLLTTWIAFRMGLITDERDRAWLRPLRCVAYMPWLAWQVAKANADVALRILLPSKGISPTVIRVPSTQVSDMARTVYANSITLTPGTISIDVSGEEITVHALSREGAEELAGGEMGDRVTALERKH